MINAQLTNGWRHFYLIAYHQLGGLSMGIIGPWTKNDPRRQIHQRLSIFTSSRTWHSRHDPFRINQENIPKEPLQLKQRPRRCPGWRLHGHDGGIHLQDLGRGAQRCLREEQGGALDGISKLLTEGSNDAPKRTLRRRNTASGPFLWLSKIYRNITMYTDYHYRIIFTQPWKQQHDDKNNMITWQNPPNST